MKIKQKEFFIYGVISKNGGESWITNGAYTFVAKKVKRHKNGLIKVFILLRTNEEIINENRIKA